MINFFLPVEHYNQFITEVQTLEIRTKEQFVTDDGQIIPKHQRDPEHVPKEYTGFGRRVTFLDLSHYQEQDLNGPCPYPAEIKRLQALALNDALCLTPDQLRMQLVRLRNLAEGYSRTIRKIGEYKNRQRAGKMNDPLFLQLKVYPFFQISTIPAVSPDDRFGHELMEAAGIKRGALTGFIDQVQRVLEEIQPGHSSAPTVEAPEVPANLRERINQTLETLDSLNLPPRFWDSSDAEQITREADETLKNRLYERLVQRDEEGGYLPPQTAEQAWNRITAYEALRHLFTLIRLERRDCNLNLIANEKLSRLNSDLKEADAIYSDKAREYHSYRPVSRQDDLLTVKRFLIGYFDEDRHTPTTFVNSDADRFTEYFVWPEFLRRYVLGEERTNRRALYRAPKTGLTAMQTVLVWSWLCEEIPDRFRVPSASNNTEKFKAIADTINRELGLTVNPGTLENHYNRSGTDVDIDTCLSL